MLVQKTAIRVQAWQLGKDTAKEAEMIQAGKIRRRPDGTYELFSQEATGETGQLAQPGDYFKVDSQGFPYPNDQAFFESRHEHLQDDWYLQKASPVAAWTADEPKTDAIRFLLERRQLEIHPDTPDRYFAAFLWGTWQTAARDAVIILQHTERNARGEITSVDFYFVAKQEFDRSYTILA